jgi:hypothetical protein
MTLASSQQGAFTARLIFHPINDFVRGFSGEMEGALWTSFVDGARLKSAPSGSKRAPYSR